MRILIGGSPCTAWSCAQWVDRETKAEGLGWELFKNYLIAKEKFKPDFFLYENNVSASKAIKEQISTELGVELQVINSLCFVPQSRNRFYAHNIPNVPQPDDRGVKLSDILVSGVPLRAEKTSCLDANYFKGGNLINYKRQSAERLVVAEEIVLLDTPTVLRDLSGILADKLRKRGVSLDDIYVAVGYKDKQGSTVTLGLMDYAAYTDASKRDRGHRIPIEVEKATTYGYEVVSGKIHAGDGWFKTILQTDGIYWVRWLTVTEACRLQTMPDDYVRGATKTSAYRGLGNGWTADVIIHILSHMNIPKDEPIEVLSMYDGIGTGRYCLDKLGFTNVTYYAYEIDKNAMEIALSNYPDIVQCGDAFDVRKDGWVLKK